MSERDQTTDTDTEKEREILPQTQRQLFEPIHHQMLVIADRAKETVV